MTTRWIPKTVMTKTNYLCLSTYPEKDDRHTLIASRVEPWMLLYVLSIYSFHSISFYIYNLTSTNESFVMFQLRVSGLMSNAPYFLMLDCDMFCNEPTSARRAMCFHLDPNMSHTLAFVQYPQIFHNLGKDDIYDAQGRTTYKVCNRWLLCSLNCIVYSRFPQS